MSLDQARARAQEIADQLSPLGPIAVSRFFGGAALSRHGVQFALVIKGSLYLRADAESRPMFEALGASPFRYAGRSGPVTVSSYYEAPDPVVEDEDALRRWVARSFRSAPVPRQRKRRHAATK